MTTEPLKQLDMWIHPKDLIELKKTFGTMNLLKPF